MKTEIIYVTPTVARELLKANTDNRPMRQGHVEALRASFTRGEYKMTHQGLAFDSAGILLDGQHRLQAIALIDDHDAAFPMLISRGMPRETFNVIDTGNVTRSISDVLRIDRDVGGVATFFATLLLTKQKSRPTPTQVQPFADVVADSVWRLNAHCASAVRTWSSSAVRAAVVVAMRRGYGDYALMVYRAMVLARFDDMPPIAQSLYRAHLAGSVRGAGGREMFIRSLKIFDPANARLSKVQIKSGNADIDAVRSEVAAWMGAAPKKKAAPVARAAKSVQADYRTAA